MPQRPTEYIELTGPGPFELPLVASIEGTVPSNDESITIISCVSGDGPPMFLPISNEAVPALVELLATLPAVHGGALPKGSPKSDERH